MIGRLYRGIRYDGWQLARLVKRARGPLSVGRYALDLVGIRWTRLRGLPPSSRESTIRLRGGVQITYRANWGDLQSFREVWLDECYRLPFTAGAGAAIDLGANIGLTSVWLAKHYGFTKVLAVEPSPLNAALVRKNLADNEIDFELIEAAAGPTDGVVYFQDDDSSNQGRVASDGREVPMVSMATLLDRLPPESEVGVVKMDIEGGEGPLMDGELGWLDRLGGVIAELHPGVIDHERVIQRFRDAGWTWVPGFTVLKHSTDAFVPDAAAVLASES